jgi:hypothetical protein
MEMRTETKRQAAQRCEAEWRRKCAALESVAARRRLSAYPQRYGEDRAVCNWFLRAGRAAWRAMAEWVEEKVAGGDRLGDVADAAEECEFWMCNHWAADGYNYWQRRGEESLTLAEGLYLMERCREWQVDTYGEAYPLAEQTEECFMNTLFYWAVCETREDWWRDAEALWAARHREEYGEE